MTSPHPDDTPRWLGHTHDEILAMVSTGPGRAAAQYAQGHWHATWFSIKLVDARLAKAIADIGSGWEGEGATATTAAVTPLGAWALQGAEQALATSKTLEAQAEYADHTRREMPPNPHPGLIQNPSAATPSDMLANWAAEDAARDNAAARAQELMQTYTFNSYDTMPGMLESPPPPTVTVSPAAAGGGVGGAGAGGVVGSSAAVLGAGGTAALAGAGPGSGAGGVAPTPGVGPGAVGVGPVGAGALGAGSAGPGSPGAGPAGRAPVGGVSGTDTGGAGAGGAVGMPRGETGQPRGGLPGAGGQARATPPGTPAPGSGALGRAAVPTSPRVDSRAVAGGGSGSGVVGESRPGGRWPVPAAPPQGPSASWPPPGSSSGGGAGPALGRGGAGDPLPPPGRVDRGSPDRPFPSSAPPAGERPVRAAAGGHGGMMPMAAGVGGDRGQERRRPSYLVDDGSAFADDRSLPSHIINETSEDRRE